MVSTKSFIPLQVLHTFQIHSPLFISFLQSMRDWPSGLPQRAPLLPAFWLGLANRELQQDSETESKVRVFILPASWKLNVTFDQKPQLIARDLHTALSVSCNCSLLERLASGIYCCIQVAPKLSSLIQHLLSHSFWVSHPQGFSKGCNQGVTWNYGFIWRLSWGRIYFQLTRMGS